MKLNKHYKFNNLNEFRTSLLNYKTNKKYNNLYLQVVIKLHLVLTFQMENNRCRCINSNKNSVNKDHQ